MTPAPNYGELAELIELARKLRVSAIQIYDGSVTVSWRATLPRPPHSEPFERASHPTMPRDEFDKLVARQEAKQAVETPEEARKRRQREELGEEG